MLTKAPTLRTSRLTLRGPEKEDLLPFTDMVMRSNRMKALGGNGTQTESWRAFISGIGHWQMRDFGFFTITNTADGTPYGRCGLLRHDGWPETELAYHLFDGAEGQSIAYESSVAVRNWAGADLGLPPLASFIAADNTRSRALATRLGAVEEGARTIDGEDALVYRHQAYDSDFAQAQWLEVCA